MRPPLNAGENLRLAVAAADAGSGFNEAPAERGGKRLHGSAHHSRSRASMRPPLNAGENGQIREGIEAVGRRFNEAPAERGGKQAEHQGGQTRPESFNEAPAERGGKRGGRRRGAVPGRGFNEAPAERGGKPARLREKLAEDGAASMRPPLNAGENRQ